MLFGLVLIISHSQCRFAKREHSYFSEEENHVSYKGWKKTTISCFQYQPVIYWPLLFTFACKNEEVSLTVVGNVTLRRTELKM